MGFRLRGFVLFFQLLRAAWFGEVWGLYLGWVCGWLKGFNFILQRGLRICFFLVGVGVVWTLREYCKDVLLNPSKSLCLIPLKFKTL